MYLRDGTHPITHRQSYFFFILKTNIYQLLPNMIMLQYQVQQHSVLPMHAIKDLYALDKYVRTLFRTDALASCHIFITASYLCFRRNCLNFIRGLQHHKQTFAFLEDGYRLEFVDGNVLVSRLVFCVTDQDSTVPPV